VRVNWNYIKAFCLLGLTIFLVVFSTQRNNRRTIENVAVVFDDESEPFVTRETVNKLLIQKDTEVTGTPKEKLALKEMEAQVNAHPIIKHADVYVNMAGQLGVTVYQRKPIVRVNGKTSFYIDMTGEKMPLSTNFAAHVPLATGVKEAQIEEVYQLANFLREDDFLKKHIIGINRQTDGNYVLSARTLNYKIMLGKVERMEQKFNNYKAFYQKASKDKSLNNYKSINLKYKNQVVCSKK